MTKYRKLLGLLLGLFLVVGISEYLKWLRIPVITGDAKTPAELSEHPDVEILSWMLPKQAKDIFYYVTSASRYYEASFQISDENFCQWIEHIQGGEVLGRTVENSSEKAEVAFNLITIPTETGIDFISHSNGTGRIHIAQGVWLPPLTNSKFRQFSASFDAQRKRAFVYFYR